MWPPLSRILEALGRARLPFPKWRPIFRAGDRAPRSQDAQGGHAWTSYANARALFDVWGPPSGSRYEPYHCVTLFAVVDRAPSHVVAPPALMDVELFEKWPVLHPTTTLLDVPWWGEDMVVVVDLPGPSSVALAARLVQRGCQPVCTFDNWPHERGNLTPEKVIGQLLRHAPVVAAARPRLTPAAPAVWLCDADRLGIGRPRGPGTFDNRYFLDDTVLPGTPILLAQGVKRLVLITGPAGTALQPDMETWLADRHKDGLEVFLARVDDDALTAAPFVPTRVVFATSSNRSDAGGFGKLIPEPSSSGG